MSNSHNRAEDKSKSDWEGLSPTEVDDDLGVAAAESNNESMAGFDELVVASSESQVVDSDRDMAQYGHRLASSTASGPSSDGEEDQTSRNRMFDPDRRVLSGRARSLSPSSSLSLSRSPSPPRSKPIALPDPKPPQPRTTFLPSLTLGGYFSGSDTDSNSNSSSNSDVNRFRKRKSHGSAPALPQPRKNRRGQRARQQIAEKKYGRGAKHLQKQQQQVHDMRSQRGGGLESGHRDKGWDVRKGATASDGPSDGRKRGRGRQDGRRFGLGGKGPTGANSEAVTSQDRTEKNRNHAHGNGKVNGSAEGPLHPSWEAAKKRKAQNQNVTALFQGKKITF